MSAKHGKHGAHSGREDREGRGGRVERDSSRGGRGGRGGWRRVAAVVLAAVVAVAVGGVAFGAHLASVGRDNLMGSSGSDGSGGSDGTPNVESVEGAHVERDKTVVYNGRRYVQNPNVVSICVIGNDKAAHAPSDGFNGQADAVMVVALDTLTGKVTCISVPRDSMVDVNRTYAGTGEFADTQAMQLCLAYAAGATDEQSSELVCTAVSRILYNVRMDYYFTVSADCVAALADAVGGVEVEALQDIPGTGIVQGQAVTLRGDEARRYVCYRDTSRYGTALERQARQQQFVRALAGRALEAAKGNPGVIVDIVSSLSDYSVTNLGAPEVTYLASEVVGRGVSSVDSTSLAGEPVHNDDSPWEQFILDKDAVLQTVLDVYFADMGPTG